MQIPKWKRDLQGMRRAHGTVMYGIILMLNSNMTTGGRQLAETGIIWIRVSDADRLQLVDGKLVLYE